MKKILIILCCFSSILYGQDLNKDSYVKVEAQRWRKGEKNLPWEYFETRIIRNLKNFNSSSETPENKFGSTFEHKTKKTGFFRTEKKKNRWWIIDPDGFYNFQRGVSGVRQGTSKQNVAFFKELYGSNRNWIENISSRFKELGFNATGSWSTDTIIQNYNFSSSSKSKLSYSMNLSIMTSYGKKRGGTYQLPGNIGFPNQTIFVFDPDFEAFCDTFVYSKINKFRNDPNLFGYFSDNELPFGNKNLEGYLSLKNPKDWGRFAAEKWLKSKNITEKNITDKERNEFAGFVAEKYYQIVSSAIKKADPNHLYLGSRLHGQAKFIPEIIRAAGKYCDIISYNYYGEWTPVDKHLRTWEKWADKPFMITEFYTKAMDSGLANTTGAGFTVKSQKDRGYAYQNFCLALLESKSCVGWHWFKYQDNDPTAEGVDPSNIDSNKGIVNNQYQYFTELTEMMKELNKQVYILIDYFDKRN